MTDHSDYAPRRLRRVDQADHDPAVIAQVMSQAEPTPTPTWLQHIANAVAQLTYGEMKEFAAGVLAKDDQAEIIVLADKFHEWALKTRD